MIILAAGYSSRMGVLKPLLPVGDRPAIMHCVSMADTLGIHDIVVVTGSRHDEIESVLREKAPEAQCVYNEKYHEGMFASIITGVRKLPADIDGFFLLPADHCAVSKSIFEELTEVFDKTGGESVVRPKCGEKRGHPPLIPARFIEPLLSYSGVDGMRGFLNTCPFTPVMTEELGVLLDMDTPRDYAQLLRYMGQPTYPDTGKCSELQEKHGTPIHVIEHCEQVAHIAHIVAALMIERGALLDTRLLNSACLLHDILRHKPNHAQEAMKLLLCEGFPDAALLVGEHMDGFCEFSGGITEADILFLADKLCRRGVVTPIGETLAQLRIKFEGDAAAFESAEKRMNRAQAILKTLRTRYGIEYNDIAKT